MRLFGLNDEKLVEYQERSFDEEHVEKHLESWLDNSPSTLLEDTDLLIVGRGVPTNLGTYIDLLGIDREGNVAIIELKRGRTPREMLAQALEYASYVEHLSYGDLEQIFKKYASDESIVLLEAHRACFKLDEGEAVAFNKDQRIVLVGERLTDPVRQTSEFLRKKGLKSRVLGLRILKLLQKSN